MLRIKAPCDLISRKSVIRSYVTQTANEFLNDRTEAGENDIGLYGSRLGKSLFLSQYYFFSKNDVYLDKSLSYLESVLHDLSSTQFDLSFSRGITGVGWLLSFYINEGVLNRKHLSLINDLEPLIKKEISWDVKFGIYDPFVGLVGRGIFYLELSKIEKKHTATVDMIVDALDHMAIRFDGDLITWSDNYSIDKKHENQQSFTLGGLAHGAPAIVIFLCQCYHQDIKKHKIKKILPGVLNWMFQYQGRSKNFCFPNCVIDGEIEDSGRLAWCVGDLGVFLAVLRAGKIINKNTYKLIEKDMNRIIGLDLEESFVDLDSDNTIDAGICHGVAGIIHMIDVLNKQMPGTIENDRINYWLDKIINQMDYLKFPPDGDEEVWGSNQGLLMGKSGLGLILLQLLNPTSTNWNTCLITGK